MTVSELLSRAAQDTPAGDKVSACACTTRSHRAPVGRPPGYQTLIKTLIKRCFYKAFMIKMTTTLVWSSVARAVLKRWHNHATVFLVFSGIVRLGCRMIQSVGVLSPRYNNPTIFPHDIITAPVSVACNYTDV